jgi:ribosomal protein S18 acetylase RimI-like enzyme
MLGAVPDTRSFDDLVRAAHGDAWQALGGLFETRGGGTASLRGMRVMASGLPHPQWNSADVGAADADIEAARAFFAERGVPWGARVPAAMAWPHGRLMCRQRLMGLFAGDFDPAPLPPGFALQAAGVADLESVLAVDAEAFESDAQAGRPWLAALLGAPATVVTVARATTAGRTVGTGYAVHSDGVAGPSVCIAGIAVAGDCRRRGLGAALSSWLVRGGFDAGAQLAHLQPDDDRAARLYAGLGFIEAGGLDIYVDI